MSEHDELQQILEAEPTEILNIKPSDVPAENQGRAEREPVKEVDYSQWEIGPNDGFKATGGTRKLLPPGVYRLYNTNAGIVFSLVRVMTDKLIDLKDSASSEIIAGIKTFWAAEKRFRERGILYKRGVLLWGPPGSGKTVTVSLLMNELIAAGGMVILCDHPSLCVAALAQVRRIEPDRRLIVVEEDIEEMMRHHGEHELLALLDGENQIANVVHIATTNYPDMLGARIVNRPSRFDEVRKIGMPNEKAREAYLVATVPEFMNHPDWPYSRLEQWVKDTEGMSIAHLRELVVAVFCLDRNYEDTMERLRKMQIKPKGHEEGFKQKESGFAGNMASAPNKKSVWTFTGIERG